MVKEKLFFRSDDDTDFMPIIPINENESEQDKNIVIPDSLPILPLRNTVLFPGVVIPITVGRDKSISLIKDAYKSKSPIGVATQLDANVEDPEFGDLYQVGTVAQIMKMLRMPDG